MELSIHGVTKIQLAPVTTHAVGASPFAAREIVITYKDYRGMEHEATVSLYSERGNEVDDIDDLVQRMAVRL